MKDSCSETQEMQVKYLIKLTSFRKQKLKQQTRISFWFLIKTFLRDFFRATTFTVTRQYLFSLSLSLSTVSKYSSPNLLIFKNKYHVSNRFAKESTIIIFLVLLKTSTLYFIPRSCNITYSSALSLGKCEEKFDLCVT